LSTTQYDVIVAGGGTAGSAAAISAARRGHRVLLVEEQNCLGGISTSGVVGEWFASLDGMGDIFAQVVCEMDRLGARYRAARYFNPEYLKWVWQQLVEDAGVEVLFHASVCGTQTKARSVREATVVCCSQSQSVRGQYFIDSTGEGDLCALAGARFLSGDPDSGLVLHMSLAAWMYDTGEPQQPCLPDGLEPIRTDAELPGLGAGVRLGAGRLYLNVTKVMGHDPMDPSSLAEAELQARRQLMRVAHYVQSRGFPTYALGGSGARIGIREGRRIVGDHLLTQDDVLGRSAPLAFRDGVAVATSQIDFHSLTKPGASGWRERVEPYNIPFRCLVARGFRNLLMAGKCISVDQVVHSSCRMTPTCCAMGQAAGTAAALAIERGARDVRDVPVSDLRGVLAAEGMELDPAKHRAFAPQDTRLDEDDLVPGGVDQVLS
jgi:hypothetical protein